MKLPGTFLPRVPLPGSPLHVFSPNAQTYKGLVSGSTPSANCNELQTDVRPCLVALRGVPSPHVAVGYGLRPKIDASSHPEEMRCDQLFGAEHKGCSVLGKLL